MPQKSKPRPRRLIDGVRSRLSEHAIDVFEQLDIVRDPERTVDDGVLRALLAERGMPAHESARTIERLAGGAQLRPGVHLGVFASLWQLELRRPTLPEDPGARLEVSSPPPVTDEPVPIVVRRHPDPWMHEVSVDARGVVHLANNQDDIEYTSPAFDTFTQYLEVYAMLRESIAWPPLDERIAWHRIRIDARVGPELALALAADPYAPASGTWCTAWRGDDIDLVEMNVAGFPADVRVGTPDEAKAAQVVCAALSLSGDVEWWSAGPRPHHQGRLPPPARRFHEHGRDVQVWGSPRAFTFDDRRAHWERLHGRR